MRCNICMCSSSVFPRSPQMCFVAGTIARSSISMQSQRVDSGDKRYSCSAQIYFAFTRAVNEELMRDRPAKTGSDSGETHSGTQFHFQLRFCGHVTASYCDALPLTACAARARLNGTNARPSSPVIFLQFLASPTDQDGLDPIHKRRPDD